MAAVGHGSFRFHQPATMHPVETLRLAPVVLYNKYVAQRSLKWLRAPLTH